MALFLSLSGCKSQQVIKDQTWWGALDDGQGAEFHTLQKDQAILTPIQVWNRWMDLTHPVICTYAENFADWKKIIETLCSYEDDCTYEEQRALSKFFLRAKYLGAVPFNPTR